MADRSAIEWTDASWNPIRARNKATGKVGWHCEHATTGCEHCYAEGFNKRLGTGLAFKPAHRHSHGLEIFLDETMLTQPLRWKKPRKIFVCSMTDLFADFVTDDMLDQIFAVMALAPRHTFQVLTKRAARMRDYCSNPAVIRRVYENVCDLTVDNDLRVVLVGDPAHEAIAPPGPRVHLDVWPLPNVWLGVSTERQQEADERILDLLRTPAAVRFISAEPLLGRIDLTMIRGLGWATTQHMNTLTGSHNPSLTDLAPKASLDWVIAGGESGPNARAMHPDWARSLRDQCAAAGVAYHFKQWGEWGPSTPDQAKGNPRSGWQTLKAHPHVARAEELYPEAGAAFIERVGKKAAGRLLDGVEHNEFPVVRR